MKKLFTNDIFFTIVTWFSVVATIPYVIVDAMYHLEPRVQFVDVMRLIIAGCMAVLFIAYKKHSKNLMKGLMGAILMAVVVTTLGALFFYEEYSSSAALSFIFSASLFISHFFINSSHKASPATIAVNQVLAILYAIICFLAGIAQLPTCVNAADTIVEILESLAQPCCILGIICIESRLDSYRLDREAAGWTEEAGYPKGYVHQYEKKK